MACAGLLAIPASYFSYSSRHFTVSLFPVYRDTDIKAGLSRPSPLLVRLAVQSVLVIQLQPWVASTMLTMIKVHSEITFAGRPT